MKNYFDEIKKKIENNINLESVEIIDNSYKHRNHKSFSSDKFHVKLIIKSSHLKSISRLSAQKQIMKILKHDLKTKIHALEIRID